MLAGKVIRLRQKLVDAADSVKGLFGMKKEQDSAVAQLERLQVREFSWLSEMKLDADSGLLPLYQIVLWQPAVSGIAQLAAVNIAIPMYLLACHACGPEVRCCGQARMEEARALFRNPDATQFVIVTIPTAMAAAESARLAKALLHEQVLVLVLACC